MPTNTFSMVIGFSDYPAPVERNSGDGHELTMMRWGMPPPLRTGGPPVTNIRNTSSPHWRGWLKPENRCLVLVNRSWVCDALPGIVYLDDSQIKRAVVEKQRRGRGWRYHTLL